MPASKSGKKGGSKKMSPYNQFVKVTIAKLKADDEKSGSKRDHKERFKQCAELWKTAPENPKRAT